MVFLLLQEKVLPNACIHWCVTPKFGYIPMCATNCRWGLGHFLIYKMGSWSWALARDVYRIGYRSQADNTSVPHGAKSHCSTQCTLPRGSSELATLKASVVSPLMDVKSASWWRKWWWEKADEIWTVSRKEKCPVKETIGMCYSGKNTGFGIWQIWAWALDIPSISLWSLTCYLVSLSISFSSTALLCPGALDLWSVGVPLSLRSPASTQTSFSSASLC